MRAAWYLVPVIVGLLQPVIWGMNLRVKAETGVIESATVLHAVGAVVGAAWFLLGMRGLGFGALGAVPWWGWLGGAVGVSCMAAATRAMPVVGVSAALALMVAAQFGSSVVFEHFGWLGLEVRAATSTRWLGAALMAVGAWLVAK